MTELVCCDQCRDKRIQTLTHGDTDLRFAYAEEVGNADDAVVYVVLRIACCQVAPGDQVRKPGGCDCRRHLTIFGQPGRAAFRRPRS